jgi:FkbM family methyltransferase
LDARLVSDKLLSIALHPIPLLGLGLSDKLKLVLLSLLAFFTLPFLLVGDDSYTTATGIASRAAPKGITIRADYGVFFCRTYDDFFMLWPSHEDELRSSFVCEANLVFIDVGAHAGRYTVMLGRQIDHVVAIEPNSENFCGLQRNVELNGLRNVSLLRYACWDKSGLGLDLFLSSTTFRHSITRPQERSERVETITLDQVLQKLRIEPTGVGLVKIDAEGAEVQILKGGKKLFSAGRPRIIFESFPEDVAIKSEILRSYGYSRIRKVGGINYVAEK